MSDRAVTIETLPWWPIISECVECVSVLKATIAIKDNQQCDTIGHFRKLRNRMDSATAIQIQGTHSSKYAQNYIEQKREVYFNEICVILFCFNASSVQLGLIPNQTF